MPGFPVVSSRAPRAKSAPRSASANAGSVVLDLDVDMPLLGLDGDEHSAAAIFGGILDQVADHLVQVLALDPHLRAVVAGDVDGDVLVQAVDRALHRLEALPHGCPRLRRGAPADGARPGEMVIDLAAHRRRLADHRRVEVGRIGGRRVGDHRQRSLERVGEIAGVPPCFLRLLLAVREELVDLLGQRADLGGEILHRGGSSSPERIEATSRRTRRNGQSP